MNTLETALSNREILLGENYQNLSKSSGSFFSRKKVLLSFDAKNGWEVVSLGRIALFLRAIGFFKSTHLKHVAKEWNTIKVTTDYKNPVLNNLLKGLWKKTYPHKAFPSYFVVLGNCDPKQAKIKIFGEQHTDSEYRKAFGKKINKKFISGDLILTEGLSKLENRKALGNSQTQFVNPDFDIQGWEPEDFKKIEDLLGNQLKISQQLESVVNELLHIVQQASSINENMIANLRKKLDQFIQLYNQLAPLAFPNESQKQIAEENLKKIEVSFKSIKDAKDTLEVVNFGNTLIKISNELVQNHVIQLKKQCVLSVFDNLKKRNDSLIQEIQRHGLPNRTLFVVSGYYHILKSKFKFISEKSDPDVNALHQTLNQHSFVIYIKRDEFEKNDFEKFNKDLNLKIFK